MMYHAAVQSQSLLRRTFHTWLEPTTGALLSQDKIDDDSTTGPPFHLFRHVLDIIELCPVVKEYKCLDELKPFVMHWLYVHLCCSLTMYFAKKNAYTINLSNMQCLPIRNNLQDTSFVFRGQQAEILVSGKKTPSELYPFDNYALPY